MSYATYYTSAGLTSMCKYYKKILWELIFLIQLIKYI